MYSKTLKFSIDWGIQGKLITAPRIESVKWVAPNAPTIKVNTDGASRALELGTTKGWSDIWVEQHSEMLSNRSGLLDRPNCHGP
ncbi:hypothetical protein IFM89_039095 [Coptis chinensis]|uniref:Uncharacterized protein n=1 Tax=Coptis chinensis TaxID=261450 RepID=A0A835MBP2_9MAGN|nr:hypothetical protein IFM89_039095 [Coptis chinensis]